MRERLALTRDKIRPLIELEHAIESLAILPERNTQLATLKQELSQLDIRSVETLKAEVQKCQKAFDSAQAEVSAIERELGKLGENLTQLETEAIPGLEKSADDVLQDATNFLEQENADDETISDIQKEYERRLERQPLEVILQNASRYEGDYQTAEQRSRDKLREAKQEYSLTSSVDVGVVLNALLDIFERRKSPETRSIKVNFADLQLPSYFSQTEPTPRITANEQFIALGKASLLKLAWLPGETEHLLQSATLNTEQAARVYELLHRSAKSSQQKTLESLLLAEKFRFVDDWRARAIRQILENLRAGKSPAPFSLTDPALDTDLLTVMDALSALHAETPYRVFSVRVFNDSKRLESLKPQLVSLARLGNPDWKRLPAEEVLRELNLVPNPSYIHLAGDWQLTLETGEILSLGGFTPSIGFPAAQTASLQSVEIHAEAVLSIENLTTFHEFVRQVQNGTYNPAAERSGRNTNYATICTYGNPSPATRCLLRLIPDETPILHWSDLDYGGFNILSQLRRLVDERVQPYRMDIATLEANYKRSRPLTVSDPANRLTTIRIPRERQLEMPTSRVSEAATLF